MVGSFKPASGNCTSVGSGSEAIPVGAGVLVGFGPGVLVGPGPGVLVGPGPGVLVGPGPGVLVGPGVGVLVGPGVVVTVGDGDGVKVTPTAKVFRQADDAGVISGISGVGAVACGFEDGADGATGSIPNFLILKAVITDNTAKTIVAKIMPIKTKFFFILLPNSVNFYKSHHLICANTGNGI